MPEPPKLDDRLKGALLVAATLVAAIRLPAEPINNSPKTVSTIADAVKLACMAKNLEQLRLGGRDTALCGKGR